MVHVYSKIIDVIQIVVNNYVKMLQYKIVILF